MIGIIGAMSIEVEMLIDAMSECKEQTISGITFHIGILSGKKAVIGQCGIGKVNAAVCAQIMISVFNADKIINSGVAGGLNPNMRQCDLIVPKDFVQHDMDTSAFGDPLGLISGINVTNIPADDALNAVLCDTAKILFNVTAYRGTIATGDQFIASAERSAFIRESFGADACDMEGGAIAHVCRMANIPFSAIRAISDNADGSADLSYAEFAEIAAKRCSALVIESVRRIK